MAKPKVGPGKIYALYLAGGGAGGGGLHFTPIFIIPEKSMTLGS